MEELVARIYAILRTNGKMQARNTIDFKDLHLDLNKRRVFIKDEEIELQNKQFNLLEYLLLNKGTILLKEQIYDRVWGIDSDVTIEIVEVYISHLRKKLLLLRLILTELRLPSSFRYMQIFLTRLCLSCILKMN